MLINKVVTKSHTNSLSLNSPKVENFMAMVFKKNVSAVFSNSYELTSVWIYVFFSCTFSQHVRKCWCVLLGCLYLQAAMSCLQNQAQVTFVGAR